MRVFCLFDRVAESSAPPLFCRNEAEAIRSVTRSFDSAVAGIPSFKWTDFSLKEIGEFDERTMVLKGITPIRDVFIDYSPPLPPKEALDGQR